MDTEMRLKRTKQDCLLWLKAFHNLQRASKLLKRFSEKINSRDHQIKEALFQAAVVSYAKPFIRTDMENRQASLSTKHLKLDKCFDSVIHEHLIDLRCKLIAHDDFTQIEPRYVWLSLQDLSNPEGLFAPFQAHLRNSCISYPQAGEDISRMRSHVSVARNGAMKVLDEKVVRTRKLLLGPV